MENQHRMIQGYRDLTELEINYINQVKELELKAAVLWDAVNLNTDNDHRWAEIAKTHLEEGFSALVRSIAKPQSPFNRTGN